MSTPAHQINADQVIDWHDRYMVQSYPRYPIVISRGEGSHLYDTSGKRYLDLFAGFGAGVLGHCHPDLVAAVSRQAGQLWHPGNLMHTQPQTQLAHAIATHGFGGQSFFCHSGADANVAAIKLARLYGHTAKRNAVSGRKPYKIICTHQSFHGRLFGAMEATGQDAVRCDFQPLLPGFEYVPYNDLAALRQQIDDETVAVMVEPIQGEGGMNVPDHGYLPGLRELCDQNDLLLICDEVWTGGGRTGRYFGYQHWGITPDIMTLAKGVGGGLPVGVMCAKPEVAQLFAWSAQHGVRHASTLGGNCLSMAAAAAIFDVLERDQLVPRAQQLGESVQNRLKHLVDRHDRVAQVRGKGLFIGIQIDNPPHPASQSPAVRWVARCREKGVLLHATRSGVMRLAPPLTISKEDLDHGLDVIEQVVKED